MNGFGFSMGHGDPAKLKDIPWTIDPDSKAHSMTTNATGKFVQYTVGHLLIKNDGTNLQTGGMAYNTVVNYNEGMPYNAAFLEYKNDNHHLLQGYELMNIRFWSQLKDSEGEEIIEQIKDIEKTALPVVIDKIPKQRTTLLGRAYDNIRTMFNPGRLPIMVKLDATTNKTTAYYFQ